MAKLGSELRTRIKQGRNTVSGRRRFCDEETSGQNRTSDGARAWAGAARRGAASPTVEAGRAERTAAGGRVSAPARAPTRFRRGEGRGGAARSRGIRELGLSFYFPIGLY
jgi:hypothetical protein